MRTIVIFAGVGIFFSAVGLGGANVRMFASIDEGAWGWVAFNVFMIVINSAALAVNIRSILRTRQLSRQLRAMRQEMDEVQLQRAWYEDLIAAAQAQPVPNHREEDR